MKRIAAALLLGGILSLSVLSTSVRAQTITAAPELISFQGRLARPDGTPVANGTYTIRFSLWSAATSGTEKWFQTITPIVVRNGTFTVLLGNGSPLSQTAINGDTYLEIKVGNDAPLAPRQRLTAVAYALKANTVPDNAITSAKIADGAVTSSKLAPGANAPGGPAGGDLQGNYPNPYLRVDPALLWKVSGALMSAAGVTTGVDQAQTQAPFVVPDQAWQSFTPSATGLLTGIDVWMGTTGATPTVDLVLYAGEGTNGAELARRTITILPTPGFQRIDLAVPVAVAGGQRYTWYLGNRSTLRFSYATGNPYAGGRSDLGQTLDYAFRTYMTVGSPQINISGALGVAGNTTLFSELFLAGIGSGITFPDGTRQVSALRDATAAVPVGTVLPFAGTVIPSGYLLCHGNEISRTEYAALFSIIGTAHGAGDGTNTFRIPDYRGLFLRMVDSAAGRDPDRDGRSAMGSGGNTGNAVGSIQFGATQRPNNPFETNVTGEHTHDIQHGSWSNGYGNAYQNSDFVTWASVSRPAGNHSHTITGGGDNETRPKNAYVNYIIKY